MLTLSQQCTLSCYTRRSPSTLLSRTDLSESPFYVRFPPSASVSLSSSDLCSDGSLCGSSGGGGVLAALLHCDALCYAVKVNASTGEVFYAKRVFQDVLGEGARVVKAKVAPNLSTKYGRHVPCAMITGRSLLVSDDSDEHDPACRVVVEDFDHPAPAIDFCFSQGSSYNHEMSSLSLYILHSDGSVGCVKPVLFDSSTASLSSVKREDGRLERMEYEIFCGTKGDGDGDGNGGGNGNGNNNKILVKKGPLSSSSSSSPSAASPDEVPDEYTSAIGRNVLATRRYIKDAYGSFNVGLSAGSFDARHLAKHHAAASSRLRASYHGYTSGQTSTMWPSRYQPNIYVPLSSSGAPPTSIASMVDPSNPYLNVVCVSDASRKVKFILLSKRIPMRFQLESPADAEIMNESISRTGIVIASVSYDQDDTATATEYSMVKIVNDACDASLVHVVTESSVHTVKINIAGCVGEAISDVGSEASAAALKGLKFPLAAPSSMVDCWSVLTSTSLSAPVSDARVSRDVKGGHVMCVAIGDDVQVFNLTAIRYLNAEAARKINNDSSSSGLHRSLTSSSSSSSSRSLDALKDVKPFVEIYSEIVEKIQKGMKGVGKLVGGRTMLKVGRAPRRGKRNCAPSVERDLFVFCFFVLAFFSLKFKYEIY